MAEAFNEYFTLIGPKLANKLPRENPAIPTPVDYSLCLLPTTPDEIFDIIKLLNNSAPGIDHINSMVIKYIAQIISEPLSQIINSSFKHGMFPNALQKAVVSPVYKAKDRSAMINYRPVSVLTTISKIYERAFYNRIYSYVF